MVPGLTSVIIPTYQHGALVGDAIKSVLAQTAPVEVFVVDDGSTDDTQNILRTGFSRIRPILLPHGGPSKARNAGLEASQGEFIMWLDADDIIAPTKVERQLSELAASPAAGWVLCDVLITDEGKGRTETASDRYNYAARVLDGWIDRMLEASNFIPIMAPLVRRSVLDGIRFADTHDGEPEDWRFWQKVAKAARVRYVPEVLATYRKRATGRNRLPKSARAVSPNITAPLRLNLGCGTQGTRSWHPIAGFVNLDKSMGWRFEDGLPEFADRSAAGISVSHALMYLPESDWPRVFAEFARVLEPGGVLRITEDNTAHPESKRFGKLWTGSESAVTMTSPGQVRKAMARAGFTAHDVTRDETRYRDPSLLQAQHGEVPNVFFMEGVKPSVVVLAPHSDDEALFAAFTILKYRPRVVICYPSVRDYGDTAIREAETRDAMNVLGGGPVEQWKGGDLAEAMRDLDRRALPSLVFAPDPCASHPDHVAVAQAARTVFGDRLRTFHTYDAAGKVTNGQRVPFEPVWVGQKLRALSRYESQIAHPRAHVFFLDSLHEFYGEGLPNEPQNL